MKHPQQIVTVGAKTTFADVWQWEQELERLHARIARHFDELSHISPKGFQGRVSLNKCGCSACDEDLPYDNATRCGIPCPKWQQYLEGDSFFHIKQSNLIKVI